MTENSQGLALQLGNGCPLVKDSGMGLPSIWSSLGL